MKKKYIIIFLLNILLMSCTSVNTEIDKKTYRAVSKNSRIKFIVIHYTGTNDEIGIKTLTTQRVSSHYLITSNDHDPIYNLVDESDRAWHAGVSEFANRSNINDTSIGIEITNYGVDPKNRDNEYFVSYDNYLDYSEGQIQKVVYLIKNLVEKYNIEPKNIVGHSDIAPLRKIDPGAKFPWERLYKEYGIGAWYNEKDKIFFMNERVYKVTSIEQIKNELKKYGYKINNTNEWDEESKRVVYNFQAHFNPKNATGIMDLETYAILKSLNKKYNINGNPKK